MGIWIDVVVLCIILLFVFISAKRGFVRSAVEAVGFIAAVLITFTISTPLSNITYDKIIEPPIMTAITASAEKSVSDFEGDFSKIPQETVKSTVSGAVDSAWDSLPAFLRGSAEKSGAVKEDVKNTLSENLKHGVTSAAETASQTVVKPVITKILSLIYSVFLLIVLMFLVKIIAKALNRVFSFSIIGTANSVLGGVLGIFKGAVIAILFCLLISAAVSFTENGFLIFTKDALKDAVLFKFLIGITPFGF